MRTRCDAQVRDLVNLVALREAQMSTASGFEGQVSIRASSPEFSSPGARSIGASSPRVSSPGARMRHKDFPNRVSKPLRPPQFLMLMGETAATPHEQSFTGTFYDQSKPSLSRGLARGAAPPGSASPIVRSPRSLDTRMVLGQRGDLSMQLMIVPSLTAKSPSIRPATAA